MKRISVEPHSFGIGCPHCGEELGIESYIEDAYDAQLAADKAEAKAEKEAMIKDFEDYTKEFLMVDGYYWRMMQGECWQAFKQKWLGDK